VSGYRKRVLELQANQIEEALARRGVRARVTGGLVFPRWIQFQISPASGEQRGKIKDLAGELALALNSDVCRVSLRRGVTVEIPRPDPQPIRLLPLQHKLAQRDELPPVTAVMGLSDEGAPLLARLPSPRVGHLLIAGEAGSGKSALLRSIVASLALRHGRRQLGLVLIAPRQRGVFGPLAGLPHLLRPVASEPEDIARALQSLVCWMPSRCNGGHPREPRIVVAVDGLDELMTLPGVQAQAWGALAQLAERGREAGIHLVACAQKPTGQAIEDLIEGNFPVRLVGRVAAGPRPRELPAESGAGLSSRPGDFVVVTGGQAIGFQAAYVSARELAEIACQALQVERGAGGGDGDRTPRAASEPARRKRSLWRLYWDLFKHWRGKRG
jgi:S-DNA-T family DNA segregation ATPase FtsK/SpoIIIE